MIFNRDSNKQRSYVFRKGGTQNYIFNNIAKKDVRNRHLELYLDPKLRKNNEKVNIEAYSKPCHTSKTEMYVNMVQS